MNRSSDSARTVKRTQCLVCGVAMLLLNACSFVIGPPPFITPVLETTSGGNPEITPFTLDVLDEVNDGEKLTIRGRFTPKVDWDAEKVLVRLAALDESGKQVQAYFTTSEKGAPLEARRLRAATPTEFTLAIPSAGITNYQVELLWGNDAIPLMAKARESSKGNEQFLALRNLEVHRVPGEDCATPNECTVKFTLTGEFYNAGSATVSNIVVIAGFLPADDLDLGDQKLDNERRVDVRNLRLPPGGTRPFRLTLEKFIPPTEQVAPRPVVRIVSFDSQK